jgi:hypothetical protein
MYYEINISFHGKHFFATAERSITDENKLREVYMILHEHFPESDGYNIEITKWEKIGHQINI